MVDTFRSMCPPAPYDLRSCQLLTMDVHTPLHAYVFLSIYIIVRASLPYLYVLWIVHLCNLYSRTPIYQITRDLIFHRDCEEYSGGIGFRCIVHFSTISLYSYLFLYSFIILFLCIVKPYISQIYGRTEMGIEKLVHYTEVLAGICYIVVRL